VYIINNVCQRFLTIFNDFYLTSERLEQLCYILTGVIDSNDAHEITCAKNTCAEVCVMRIWLVATRPAARTSTKRLYSSTSSDATNLGAGWPDIGIPLLYIPH